MVAGRINGRVPRATSLEECFDDMGEVAFGVSFFDDAIVNGIAERGEL